MTQPRHLRSVSTEAPAVEREPLWRDVLGERLRQRRQDAGERITDTASRAGMSPQYLSEVERGRKEPSSEMIAALAAALGTTLAGLTEEVTRELRHRAGESRRSTALLLAA